MLYLVSVLLCLGTVLGADNGKAQTPPMGWRSWNCYGGNVNQKKMESIMDKMAERTRQVDGKNTSMVDLGYNNCGLDDNWQQCGKGYMKSFHDEAGNPLVRSDTFPSMKNMTDYGHSLNIDVGWYMNNCICQEKQFTKDPAYIKKHMEQSVKAIVAAGFDGIKLDGCGEFRNLTWWYALLNASGREVLIENCHWGGTVPNSTAGDAPCTGTTPIGNCPYNFYRTSGDIRNNWKSMTGNLHTTIKFQGEVPLSRPGQWAYPDMMEVGRMANHDEDQSHFGAWAITSSPLILGYDLNDEAATSKIWDIISNKEVIAVNQHWEGHPGRLVKEWDPSNPNIKIKVNASTGYMLWAKKQAKGAQAVLLINSQATTTKPAPVTFTLSEIGITSSSATVRDLWNHKDLGTVTKSVTTASVAPHASVFLLITPK